jgi:hypothetical protein
LAILESNSWSGGGGGGAALPDQSGHGGQFLKTDGATPSWAAVVQATLENTYYRGAYFTGGTKVTAPVTLNPGTGDFTIALWGWWGARQSGNYPNIVGANSGGFGGHEGYLRWWGPGSPSQAPGKISVGNPSADYDLISATAVPKYTWTHIVVTRNSGTMKIYINGAEDASGASSSNYDWSAGGGIAMGVSVWDGANGYWDGQAQELKMFNIGWSAGDVTADYNSGAGVYGTGSETGMVAGFHLNGDLIDYKAGNNGSWSGASAYYAGAVLSGTAAGPVEYLVPAAFAGGVTGATGSIRRRIGGAFTYVPYFPPGGSTRSGTAVLVAGAKAVTNTSVTAYTEVTLQRKVPGGTTGALYYSTNPGSGFTILSESGSDTSTVFYELVENV